MKKDNKKQILNHKVKKFSLIIKNVIDMFFFSKTLTKDNKNVVLQVNSISNIKKILKNLKWHIRKTNCIKL